MCNNAKSASEVQSLKAVMFDDVRMMFTVMVVGVGRNIQTFKCSFITSHSF